MRMEQSWGPEHGAFAALLQSALDINSVAALSSFF
jgi:hypothetical protein